MCYLYRRTGLIVFLSWGTLPRAHFHRPQHKCIDARYSGAARCGFTVSPQYLKELYTSCKNVFESKASLLQNGLRYASSAQRQHIYGNTKMVFDDLLPRSPFLPKAFRLARATCVVALVHPTRTGLHFVSPTYLRLGGACTEGTKTAHTHNRPRWNSTSELTYHPS